MAISLGSRVPMIDIGINLTDAMYLGVYHGQKKHPSDIDNVLSRALAVGVRCLLITAGNLEESRHAISLCKKYSSNTLQCFCTVGCHPTRCGEFVKDAEKYYNELKTLIAEHTIHKEGGCVAAIGEIGLDYDRLFFCEKEVQLLYFVKQIGLAEEFQLPLFLHDRNTGLDFYNIMKQHRHRFNGGVVHSFTGTSEELEKLLELDFYIGVNGCSFKTKDNIEVVKTIPIDRLMIETDGPWCEMRNTHASYELLKNVAKRGGISEKLLSSFSICKKEKFVEGAIIKSRCEPCHVVRVLDILYELHHEKVKSLEDLALTIYKNTCQLFPFRSHDITNS